ncbi:methyltransferase family protein [Paenibacillus cellulosilyticus]|uniref:Methyltransferase family protein n=1 Tax=Paenibacillus cellulosilyticus TaxID=375489 RepID=A0A2V2YUR3_9BACL|nr:class I SAM-dependent methyltransferase [Paenibacillus cellulosilyticus]PWV99641.1 methyltransferase family protein [Paenibacillus cellulosilyticus]QKS44918.1 class I SAM-dependent methyltransferase [Paenibacillus cellulosilyticus]
MNPTEYKQFYEQVGRLNGWNFSHVKCTTTGVQWNFYEEVASRCRPSDILLDIGTGGGEALLSIADAALLLIGIDNASGMLETANLNITRSGKSNVRILPMDADQLLNFPDSFFNIVSNRHCGFFASEVSRVLAAGGFFLTQQVSEGDKMNLKQAFSRGQAFGIPDGTLLKQYQSELREAGFRSVQSFEYDAAEYYHSAEDLLFLLKHTPIIPNFGHDVHDFAVLEQFIADNRTEHGIRTNAKRFMIIATK